MGRASPEIACIAGLVDFFGHCLFPLTITCAHFSDQAQIHTQIDASFSRTTSCSLVWFGQKNKNKYKIKTNKLGFDILRDYLFISPLINTALVFHRIKMSDKYWRTNVSMCSWQYQVHVKKVLFFLLTLQINKKLSLSCERDYSERFFSWRCSFLFCKYFLIIVTFSDSHLNKQPS